MRHLLTLEDWSPAQIAEAIAMARTIKANPAKYADVLRRKTLCMIFEKPSLRTRLSFEAGMNQLGGHAIYYDTSTSPIGAGKESIADTVRTMCRYVDIIMARLFKHEDLLEMARYATVPIINALTNFSHPGQILADHTSVGWMGTQHTSDCTELAALRPGSEAIGGLIQRNALFGVLTRALGLAVPA